MLQTFVPPWKWILAAVTALMLGLLFIHTHNAGCGFSVLSCSPNQPTATATSLSDQPLPSDIDEHLPLGALHDVTFCETAYRAQAAVVDNIDLIQRASEIAAQNRKFAAHPQYAGTREICSMLRNQYAPDSVLPIIVHAPANSAPQPGDQIIYAVEILPPNTQAIELQFNFNFTNNTIYQVRSASFPNDGGMGVFIPIGNIN
jgi:hypothetical protein